LVGKDFVIRRLKRGMTSIFEVELRRKNFEKLFLELKKAGR